MTGRSIIVMGETKATIFQTIIVVTILTIAIGIAYVLVKVLPILLGILIFGLGLYTFVFVAGKTKYQTKAFTMMFINMGKVMMLIGIIIIALSVLL